MRAITFAGCFGWLHPGGGPQGVVLCGPLGWESVHVHRAWRELAESLADRGVSALRFDYPGMGDSTGDGHEQVRLASWLAGIEAAVQRLREVPHVRSITLLGMRFGATLAAACAERLGDVDGLVMLAPVPSGRAYARELAIVADLGQRLQRDESRPRPDANWLSTAPADLAELETLQILAGPHRPAPRALVLGCEGLPADQGLGDLLRARGVDLEEGQFVGQIRLMGDWDSSPYPREAFSRVVNWIARDETAPMIAEPDEHAVRLAQPDIVEVAFKFGPPPGLFGLLCRPLPPSDDAQLGVLFLNTGLESHIGPNRLWVSTSRLMARCGMTALRFDLSGVGDSPGKDSSVARTLETGLTDITRAIDELEVRGVSRIVLVGYCLGAALAWKSARTDSRVVGQFLINPFRNFWVDDAEVDLGRRTMASYVRLAANPATWRRLLTGGVSTAGFFSAVTGLASSAIRHFRGPVAGGEAVGQAEARSIGKLSARGVKTVIVYGDGDALFQEFRDWFGADPRQIAERLGVTLKVVAGMNHGFPRRADRDALVTLLVEQTAGIPRIDAEVTSLAGTSVQST